MTEQIHAPTIGELPTTRQLDKATLIAAGVAAALLATTVLPAEYSIDPTGVGGVLGLTQMGQAKRAAAEPAEVVEDTGDIVINAPTQATTTAVPAGAQTQEVRFTLAPDEGTESMETLTQTAPVLAQSATCSKNAAATRDAILEAARQRFLLESYENVGLRDIAGHVGCDVALVSRYFGGKEKLFAQVLAKREGVVQHDVVTADLASYLTRIFLEQDGAAAVRMPTGCC